MEGNIPLRGLFILLLGTALAFLIVGSGSALKASMSSEGNNGASLNNKDLYQLLILTNADRQQDKLKPLKLNRSLVISAQDKCKDMVVRNYWGHITPDGRSVDAFIRRAGLKNFSKVSENIAIGQHGLVEVNNDWMNSPSHREAIMDEEYTDVGFAQCTYDSKIPGLEPATMYVAHFLVK